jgi:hypothetical protein
MNGIILRGSISILSGAQKMAISVRIVRSQPRLVLQGNRCRDPFHPDTRENRYL